MRTMLNYTINHTTYGTKTIQGRYNTACTWALWGEEGVLVVNETGVLLDPQMVATWLEDPKDGSKPG
jgi:hypothetical protein